ncbi:hypothetical protein P6F26_04585 [Roseibacterium sp. SDUM158017]|uniref:hypothetical protein n=1 Tax=Roseicyclus salinarum TaxID=3036773 RepID=UPI0024155C15|nr:hypothetical protein [Roseibacterium sp. SDUM158017]MDG4647710.1 hypothetical protein [Roseibacterium sp. SDUM158017]
MPLESTYIAMLCAMIGGAEPESRQFFDVYGYARPRYISVDCETPSHVIEIGMDETVSARDSVHQAALAASFTGKTPWVILIDTDGAEGRYELEMRHVTRLLDVAYTSCSLAFLERWAATAAFRGPRTFGESDLPADPTVAGRCPLGRVAGEAGTSSATN